MPFRARARPASLRRHCAPPLRPLPYHRPSLPDAYSTLTSSTLPSASSSSSSSTLSFFTPHLQSRSSSSFPSSPLDFLTSLFLRRTSPPVSSPPVASSSSSPIPSSSQTASSARASFLSALPADGTPDIAAATSAYAVLTSPVSPPFASAPSLSAADILHAMRVLSTCASPRALTLLHLLYKDASRVFGHAVTAEHRRAVLVGLSTQGHAKQVLALARTMGAGEGVDWEEVLQCGIRVDDWETVRACEAEMRKGGAMGGKEYALLLRAVRMEAGRLGRKRLAQEPERVEQLKDRVEQLVREARVMGLDHAEDVEVELVRVWIGLLEVDKAGDIVRGWESQMKRTRGMSEAAAEYWLEMGSIDRALEELGECESGEPGQTLRVIAKRTVAQVVQASAGSPGVNDVVRSVEKLEEKLGGQVRQEMWIAALEAVIFGPRDRKDRQPVDVALEVYHVARSRGVPASIDLAYPLIEALSSLLPPQPTQALEIYNDLRPALFAASLSHADRDTLSKIYTHLLRALAGTPSDLAPLLADMSALSISLAAPHLSALLGSAMRAAGSHEAAYQLIGQFDTTQLDFAAWQALLTAFLSLTFPPRSLAPPPHLVTALMRSMVLAGHPPGSRKVLTSLLSLYGAQAKTLTRSLIRAPPGAVAIPKEERMRSIAILARDVERVHELINFDPTLTLDTALLNALMDAYQRVGSFDLAWRVWLQLVERHPREDPRRAREQYPASIVIALDACAHHGMLREARSVWTRAARWGLTTGTGSRPVWDGWVESLCKLGEFDEAVDTLEHMDEPGGVGVGKESVEIVFRFSMGLVDPREEGLRIRQRVKALRPELFREIHMRWMREKNEWTKRNEEEKRGHGLKATGKSEETGEGASSI